MNSVQLRSLIRAGCLLLAAALPALLAAQQNRVTGRINTNQRTALSGHIHPSAIAANDQGLADPALVLSHMTVVLQPSTGQQAALDELLAEQQDPGSANYHKWLTPEEYADRFGASQSDIEKISAWLESASLSVTSVARGRNAISVSGTAAQAGSAFATEIHLYQVNGKMHYANATEPSVPAALSGVVRSIQGLHNFRMRARRHQLTPLGLSGAAAPAYTSSSGNHYLAPDDFATVFDLKPLYNAGITGTGQKIVVVGQSQIDKTRLATFRTYFGLSSATLTATLVPNTTDPGVSVDDEQESDLDLQWSSAVARNASLVFVYSYDVTDAVQYAIDQNLAPVLSMSYGLCEASASASYASTLRTWAQQGAAQGITWVAASGDSGAADCYQASSGSSFGGRGSALTLGVDLPASIPEVTGVGGTTLSEGTGSYWASSNDSTTKASALSYIPEAAWNDSTTGDPASSGGGASKYFSKPSWQTGTGVPSDAARDVPDVAFPASAEHDGYLVYTSSGQNAGWYVFGGTSAGAPTFSGVLALLNQYMVNNGYQASAGLGNANAHLYSFAAAVPSAFHDITSGDNIVSASSCTGSRCGSSSTTSVGYSTTAGYDQVTGLGTIDAYNFVTAWHTSALLTTSTPTVTLSASPAAIARGSSATLTATVTGSTSTAPTGTVTFSAGGTALGSATLTGSSGVATAALTVSGSASALILGSNLVTASYAGDSGYNAASGTATLTVSAASAATPTITGVTNGASYKAVYAPGMLMSIFGTQLSLTTGGVSALPLPVSMDNVSVTVNGVVAPLYYISPGQLNAQIPYAAPAGQTVAVVVSNNGQSASTTIQIAAAAPGIFFDTSTGALVPAASAQRGETISLYFTGAGAVSPAVTTGEVPAAGSTPVPVGTTLVTVGGVAAQTKYLGIPSWSVGIVQGNFTVPADAPLGAQQVVVSVGGVASAGATLTVTQ
jgi:uncharacterized protein (TIGR03437 family)